MKNSALFLVIALALAWTLPASRAAAQTGPLITGLGGEAGFGTGVLEYNDDGSSGEIDLRPAFPNGLDYFGQRFNSFFVNNNGSITFGGATGLYTPEVFPVQGNRMIAAFWGDVDTRGGGRPTRNGVYWDVRPGRIVITWYNVGFFSQHDDHQNTFQIVIESTPLLDQDHIWRVEFHYARCEWTTGDASGGHGGFGGNPAQAGFDAGDGHTAQVLPGSGTRGILRLCRDTNVGEPGVWIFNVENGMPSVNIGPSQPTSIDYSQGSGAPARPSRRRHR